MINDPNAVDLHDERTTLWWLEYVFEDGEKRKSIKMSNLALVRESAIKARKVQGLVGVNLMSETTWVRTQNRNDLLP